MAQIPSASRPLTWQETEERFRQNNPTLLAGKVNIDEARADEITAYLRPNPDFTLLTDGTQIAPYGGVWRPFAGTMFSTSFGYLHERRHKRELRLESAQGATAIALSSQNDLERNLLFNLRDAFVRVLEAKAIRNLASENLSYYDKEIEINRQRFQAGGMSKVDFQRVELQRVQFESDLATAQVNLRTAKIDLLEFLHDSTPVEEFDIEEPFDFREQPGTLGELRAMAMQSRPDLEAAQRALNKARVDHELAVANGSTDPTLSAWWSHNPSFNNPNANETLGASISIPLRIFDKNQGEKLKTELDIGRNEKLRDAAGVSVTHDVDSAYVTLQNTIQLLKSYKSTYLQEAVQVRETVAFAYQHGAASLIDFLDAQKEYRSTQLNYLNLVGAYLSAANQVNFAVGREVIR